LVYSQAGRRAYKRNALYEETHLLIGGPCVRGIVCHGVTADIARAPVQGHGTASPSRSRTKWELAQRYFDHGLTLCFNFNHAEAIRSFSAAAQIDPDCAMAYWGIAFAARPARQRAHGHKRRARDMGGPAKGNCPQTQG
jgi:hypothetical protein